MYLKAVTGFENELALNVGLIVLGLALLAPIRELLWGAIFNPVHNVALIIRGKGGGIALNLMRMVGQLVGAILGSIAAVRLVPLHLQG